MEGLLRRPPLSRGRPVRARDRVDDVTAPPGASFREFQPPAQARAFARRGGGPSRPRSDGRARGSAPRRTDPPRARLGGSRPLLARPGPSAPRRRPAPPPRGQKNPPLSGGILEDR